MAIDPLSETLITLADAAKLLPARRGGRRPHLSCLYRWTASGCKGVILESIQVGGTRCTSKEALARFLGRLTAEVGGGASNAVDGLAGESATAAADAASAAAFAPPLAVPPAVLSSAAVRQAEAILDAAGI